MTEHEEWKLNVFKAIDYQARDDGLWFTSQYITEHYLQTALRDLHRVIESNDQDALKRIIERVRDL